jgi:uncharacterized membrane protein YgdD (TMEM256/DUF423 family)
MTARSQKLLATAGILVALATALGAFGTHSLKPRLEPAAFFAYESAVQYHFYHALGLLGIALAMRDGDNAPLRWSARLVLLGIGLFGGSIYLITFGAPKALGIVTPFGGLSLMVAWVLFAVGVTRPRQQPQ